MTLTSEGMKAKTIPMNQLSLLTSSGSHSYENFSPSTVPQQIPIKHRKKFSAEEDEILSEMVEKFGPKKWNRIAQYLPFRTARQCRDRYCNYLAPGFFNGEWLQEEDDLLYEKYKEIGPKWAQMKVFFKNRSPNSLKNRWNYFVSKMHPSVQASDQKNSATKEDANNAEDKKNDANEHEKVLLTSEIVAEESNTESKKINNINLTDNPNDSFKIYYDICINPQNLNLGFLSNNITEFKRTNLNDDFEEIYTFPSLAHTPLIPVQETETYDLGGLSFDIGSPIPF